MVVGSQTLAFSLEKNFFLTFCQFSKTFFGVFVLPVCCFDFAMQRVIFVPRGVLLHRKFCDVIIVLYAWLEGVFAFVVWEGPDLYAFG